MAFKRYTLPELGEITIYKRKKVRAIKLSVSHDNEIKVTIPTWTPYQVGLEFARKNWNWINSHKSTADNLLKNGQRLGKAHRLVFIENPAAVKITTRISGNEARVVLPIAINPEATEAQTAAKKIGLRTLKREATELLPKRLKALATSNSFDFRSVKIKQLKTRWGSCNSSGDIALNLFLMQLPWETIDYVILHELTHTRVLAHGRAFWQELAKVLPEYKKQRKEIKNYKPALSITSVTT